MSVSDEVRLAPTGHEVLLTHAALWGAGAIASTVCGGSRIGWTAGLAPAPVLRGIGIEDLADAVHERAVQATDPEHWVQAGLPHEPERALFSPRVKTLPDEASWVAWQQARAEHVNRLTTDVSVLDLRMLAGLGEPSSWHEFNGKPRQDHAASRLEMQPRNQGSEFVGTRLRLLAAAVGGRSPEQVAAGLTGARRVDEAGNDSPDSRSSANLRPPGPTDNALAWVAMWGLASAPVVHQLRRPSRTAIHLPWQRDMGLSDEVRAGHFVVPLWRGWWTVARLRSVLSSRALAEVGTFALTADRVPAGREQQWLTSRGVTGVVVMPVHTYGSTSSPERRAMSGRSIRLDRDPS